MKLLGIIVVALAAWGYGSKLIFNLNQHRKQLFDLQELLQWMAANIRYGKQPLADVCENCAQRLGEPFSPVLHQISEKLSSQDCGDFQGIWEEQLVQHRREFLLSEQEFQVIKDIGRILGELDVEAQLRHLELYQQEVKGLLRSYESEIQEKKKVYRGVSLLIGAMVIILLL